MSHLATSEIAALWVNYPLEEPASPTQSAAERHLWEHNLLLQKGVQVFPGAVREGRTELGRGKYCFSSHTENCPWCNGMFNTFQPIS